MLVGEDERGLPATRGRKGPYLFLRIYLGGKTSEEQVAPVGGKRRFGIAGVIHNQRYCCSRAVGSVLVDVVFPVLIRREHDGSSIGRPSGRPVVSRRKGETRRGSPREVEHPDAAARGSTGDC